MAYSYHIAEEEGFLLHYPLFGETMRSAPLLSTLVQVGFLLSSIDCVSWCFICFTVFHGVSCFMVFHVSWCFIVFRVLDMFKQFLILALARALHGENFSSGVPVYVLVTFPIMPYLCPSF